MINTYDIVRVGTAGNRIGIVTEASAHSAFLGIVGIATPVGEYYEVMLWWEGYFNIYTFNTEEDRVMRWVDIRVHQIVKAQGDGTYGIILSHSSTRVSVMWSLVQLHERQHLRYSEIVAWDLICD